MTYTKNMHRSGLTALAAVLALSSTPAFAQDATVPQPVVETPATAPPAVDPIAPLDPVTTTTTTTETTTVPVSDPLAPEPVAATAVAKTTRTTTSRTTTRRATSVSRPTRTAAPNVAAPAVTPEPMAPIAEPIAPMVAEAARVARIATPPVEDTSIFANDDMLPIAGAAGLGLLALLGAGAAMRRRKRRNEALDIIEWNEPAFATAAVPVAPAARRAEPVAPRNAEPASAFGWAPRPATATAPAGSLPDGIDATKLGHHVQAAYRGPTAENPSLSLKRRIKRAAFFDQRERLAAKGKAVAVAPGAGLPDAMAEQAIRVRDTVSARTSRPMNYQSQFQPSWS